MNLSEIVEVVRTETGSRLGMRRAVSALKQDEPGFCLARFAFWKFLSWYGEVFLFALLFLFVLEFSLFLQGMFRFLFLFFLTFVFFASVTHTCLLLGFI